MKKLNNLEALKLIDGLCMCFWNGKEDLVSATKIIENIFEVAHGHDNSASCHYVHKDWRKNSIKLYKDLKKAGMCS